MYIGATYWPWVWTYMGARTFVCIARWIEKFGDFNIGEISERYATGIASPKDFGSHFKLIMHRKF